MYCNLEKLKDTFSKKKLRLSIVYSMSEILKVVGLINNIEEHNRIYNHVWREYKSEKKRKLKIIY